MKNINKLEQIREYFDLKENDNVTYGIEYDESRGIATISVYYEEEDMDNDNEGKEVARFSINKVSLNLEFLHEDFSYYVHDDMMKKIQEILSL